MGFLFLCEDGPSTLLEKARSRSRNCATQRRKEGVPKVGPTKEAAVWEGSYKEGGLDAFREGGKSRKRVLKWQKVGKKKGGRKSQIVVVVAAEKNKHAIMPNYCM